MSLQKMKCPRSPDLTRQHKANFSSLCYDDFETQIFLKIPTPGRDAHVCSLFPHPHILPKAPTNPTQLALLLTAVSLLGARTALAEVLTMLAKQRHSIITGILKSLSLKLHYSVGS